MTIPEPIRYVAGICRECLTRQFHGERRVDVGAPARILRQVQQVAAQGSIAVAAAAERRAFDEARAAAERRVTEEANAGHLRRAEEETRAAESSRMVADAPAFEVYPRDPRGRRDPRARRGRGGRGDPRDRRDPRDGIS